MKIGIHGKFFSREHYAFVQEIFDLLHQRQAEIFTTDSYHKALKKTPISAGDVGIIQRGDDISYLDVMLSIGGDGTFLDTVTYTAKYDAPVLGVNIGRLGFLASTTETNFKQALDMLDEKRYEYEYRTLLRLNTNRDLFDGINFALNEFAILKKDTSSMIIVHAYLDGEYLNSYWSDGLIVSTPTGSTGYSLSCGGPFVLPHSRNFIITPISAHNLNIRPMVVSDDSEISFEIEGRGKNFLATLDSRYCTVDPSIKMSVKKESFKAKLVKLEGSSFFDTLRQKLNWGVDARTNRL